MAFATTHRAEELDADLVVRDLSTLSALVIGEEGEISIRDQACDQGCPPLSTMRTAETGQDRTSALLIT
ncbi:hypothetical protein ABZ079_11700 [Streptomyces sp. NPDC006314]|uniref:hypothetical protein n=1 Tax=Streptomyces sp. NPDC006314 TaxID=3154475 RepID=UPI0033B4258F